MAPETAPVRSAATPLEATADAPSLATRLKFTYLIARLGLVSLLWALAAPVVQLFTSRRLGTRIGRVVISNFYGAFWNSAERMGMMRIESSALDVLRDEPGGLIIAANHPTMFDALIVVARIRRGVCVMKAELLDNVFLGTGARLARYIRNDAGRGMVRDAVATAREGGQLVLFPEGTRTTRRPINPLRPGITLIAHLAQVPIQTVVIETDSPYLTKGWPLLKAPPAPVVVRVRLGERFEPQADHRALLRRLEAYFARELP